MAKALALFYSSSTESGNTSTLLKSLVHGMERGGDNVGIRAVKGLSISPCMGELHCWSKTPGQCYIQDDMQGLYREMKEASTIVLGTPVYIPLPGEMQNLLNRLCPLLEPELVTRDGRTRARMRDGVLISRMVLVATSGWWELENLDTVVRIVKELAEDASVEFAGAVLRPHAHMALHSGEKTQEILDAAERAGFELAARGSMSASSLALVSQPIVGQEEYLRQSMS